MASVQLLPYRRNRPHDRIDRRQGDPAPTHHTQTYRKQRQRHAQRNPQTDIAEPESGQGHWHSRRSTRHLRCPTGAMIKDDIIASSVNARPATNVHGDTQDSAYAAWPAVTVLSTSPVQKIGRASPAAPNAKTPQQAPDTALM